MKLIIGALVAAVLLLGGCTVEVLAPEVADTVHGHDEVREPFIELDVVRAGNTYWTNELDIWDNKLAFDCRRVSITEKWETTSICLILFSHEGWDCYDCPDVVDTYNAAAGVYVNEWF